MDCMILNMNSLRSIETPVTFHHPIKHKIPEDLSLQQHCCENLKSHWSMENEVVDMPPALILATVPGTVASMAMLM